MADKETKKEDTVIATDTVTQKPSDVVNTEETKNVSASSGSEQKVSDNAKGGGRKGRDVSAGRNTFTKNRRTPRKSRRHGERERPEFDHKIASIRRVSRVVAGGRRFSFSVAVVAGDKRGRVGVGTGKATDTALAIEKALRSAKKNMITVPRTDKHSISKATSAKWAASEITLRPAPGRGLVAGSSVRVALELAGISNVSAKILSRSKNKLNNANATVEALRKLTV
jgi:small subunit ribosomal protein S5